MRAAAPYEKNLEDFLRLDLPGSEVVYGVGPLTASLQRRHPAVHWRGVVPRAALPAIYSAADAFVLPSRSETFGLVMLEAMACGTPVAAIQRPGRSTRSARGAKAACWTPTCVPRRSGRCGCRASTRALRFDWSAVCDQFLGHLVPALGGHGLAESALSTAAAARDRSPAGSP